MSRDHLGEFEHMLLLAVLGLEPEAHGAAIRRILEERAGRKASLGAIYATIRRLEEKGHLSVSERPSPRGGRPRRVASVTRPGLEALQRSRAALEGLWAGVDDRLEGGRA